MLQVTESSYGGGACYPLQSGASSQDTTLIAVVLCRSERQCSITAAYTLVISEKELINDALQAINTSLGKEPEAS